MEHVTSQAVIALCLAEVRPGSVVAFDGDGTLWDGDVGDELFFALLEHGDVRPPAHARLAEEARAHSLDATGTGVELARRLFESYRAGTYSERHACEMIGWLCAGWSRAEVERFAAGTLGATFEARLHPEAVEIGRAASRAGARVVLVSASPHHVVEAASRRLGFPAEVVATTPVYDEAGVMLPRVVEPIPYDEGKVNNLRALVGEAPLIAAFGDNAFDVPMLRAARVGIAVRPKARLLARAAEVPGLLTVDATSASALEPRASGA